MNIKDYILKNKTKFYEITIDDGNTKYIIIREINNGWKFMKLEGKNGSTERFKTAKGLIKHLDKIKLK